MMSKALWHQARDQNTGQVCGSVVELFLLVKPYLPSCCAVPLRASTSSAAPSAGRQMAADRSFLQSGGGNYIKH
jgi:hypothetical protein